MEFSITNNVDGIRDLFERGLAAPSHRDEAGVTPLTVYLVLHGLLKQHHSHKLVGCMQRSIRSMPTSSGAGV